jgi:hypothetical protein
MKSFLQIRKPTLYYQYKCTNGTNQSRRERVKMLFIVPTDAHYYKIVEKLKHLKLGHLLRHVSVHAGTIIREQSCA